MDWWFALLVVAGVTLALWVVTVAVIWLHRPSRELALPALRLLPDILRLCRRILADPTSPRAVRIALLGLAAWILSPIDLLPEFLPGIGALDDIVVAVVVLRWVGRRLDPAAIERHWPGSPEGLALLRRLL